MILHSWPVMPQFTHSLIRKRAFLRMISSFVGRVRVNWTYSVEDWVISVQISMRVDPSFVEQEISGEWQIRNIWIIVLFLTSVRLQASEPFFFYSRLLLHEQRFSHTWISIFIRQVQLNIEVYKLGISGYRFLHTKYREDKPHDMGDTLHIFLVQDRFKS